MLPSVAIFYPRNSSRKTWAEWLNPRLNLAVKQTQCHPSGKATPAKPRIKPPRHYITVSLRHSLTIASSQTLRITPSSRLISRVIHSERDRPLPVALRFKVSITSSVSLILTVLLFRPLLIFHHPHSSIFSA